jgi:Protein of unknown function (DUF732)
VADLGPELTQNRPRNQMVRLEFADRDGDVVLAKVRKVIESCTVHMHNEAVTDGGNGRAVGVLQHSGRVDGDVALRIAEYGEDIGCWRGDRTLDFDSLGHDLILADGCGNVGVSGHWSRYDDGADVRDDGAMRRALAMMGVAAVLGVTPPAYADPGNPDPNLDASFLDSLVKAGITVNSRPGAVRAGKAACGMMEQGRPELDVIELVTRQNPGLDTTRAAQFTAIAASAYCPQFLQRVGDNGGSQPQPPVTPGASISR